MNAEELVLVAKQLYTDYEENRLFAIEYPGYANALKVSEQRRAQLVDLAMDNGVKIFGGSIKDLIKRIGVAI